MSTEEKTQWKKPTGKIKIKLINKGVNPLITDPSHEAFNLFGTATRDYLIPMDAQGNLHNPFSCKEEQEWLEKELDVDLNWHKDKDNYWHTTKVSLGKQDLEIELDNPKKYILYLIARANKRYVAPTLADEKLRATYKYVIVQEHDEVKKSAGKINKNKEAYKFFGKIEEDRQAMLDFLKVYGRKVSSVSKANFLVQEIGKIIEEDIDGFLEIANDKENYDIKLLIENAVEAGAIKKDRRKYHLPGGDPLCGEGDAPTLQNAITYLSKKANQDILTTLKARVKTAKD
jgi:hypothetical protein